MSKLQTTFTRCLLPAPRPLPGLGVVKGLTVPVCAGLVFATPAAMARHLEECHGGAEGQWSDPVPDQPYAERDTRPVCACGAPRHPKLDSCVECRRKTIQFHKGQWLRSRTQNPRKRSKDAVRGQMLRDAARANGMCTTLCGEKADVDGVLCAGCKEVAAERHRAWKERAKVKEVAK